MQRLALGIIVVVVVFTAVVAGVLIRNRRATLAETVPASSAVRNDEPQPHAATAFGLFTVKPAPMSVST